MKASMSFVLLLPMTLLALGGCGRSSDIGKEKAVEIASKEVARRGWKACEVRDACRADRYWRVTFMSARWTRGEGGTVDVSPEGKVLRMMPGR